MLTLLTALEIFSHPNDLCINVFLDDKSRKWGVIIYRGPGHNYKLMLSSSPFLNTKSDAVNSVKKILLATCKASKDAIKDKDSFVSKLLKSTDPQLDKKIINKITQHLKNHDSVETHKLLSACN